jgi:hypothetical protein
VAVLIGGYREVRGERLSSLEGIERSEESGYSHWRLLRGQRRVAVLIGGTRGVRGEWLFSLEVVERSEESGCPH